MKITGRNKSILLETAMRLGTVTAATVMTEVYRRSPGPAEMSPVLARSRTSLLLHPQELGFVVSALWQRSLAWCAKIPARQGSPGKIGEREREGGAGTAELPLPLESRGVPRQQSRSRDSSVPHGRWAKEPQPRQSCGARLCSSPLPAFDVQALVLGKSSARAFVGGHCQGQACHWQWSG